MRGGKNKPNLLIERGYSIHPGCKFHNNIMCKNANAHAHKVQKKKRNRGKEKSTQHHKKIENEYATKTKQMISFVLIYYECSVRARS